MGTKIIERQFEDCDGNKINFIANTLPAGTGWVLLQKLLLIKAKALKCINGDNLKELSLANIDIDFDKISKSLTKILSKDEENFHLIKKLLTSSKINGKDLANDLVFDDVFSGDYSLLLEVLSFVLIKNFGSLFKKKFFLNVKNIFTN